MILFAALQKPEIGVREARRAGGQLVPMASVAFRVAWGDSGRLSAATFGFSADTCVGGTRCPGQGHMKRRRVERAAPPPHFTGTLHALREVNPCDLLEILLTVPGGHGSQQMPPSCSPSSSYVAQLPENRPPFPIVSLISPCQKSLSFAVLALFYIPGFHQGLENHAPGAFFRMFCRLENRNGPTTFRGLLRRPEWRVSVFHGINRMPDPDD